MDIFAFFKSIIDSDKAPVVICNLEHTIIYMNAAAIKNYEKRGGEKLLGENLLLCHNPNSVELIKKNLEWFRCSKENNIVYEGRNEKLNKDIYMIALRDDDGELIGYYEKHEFRNPETMKLYDYSV